MGTVLDPRMDTGVNRGPRIRPVATSHRFRGFLDRGPHPLYRDGAGEAVLVLALVIGIGASFGLLFALSVMIFDMNLFGMAVARFQSFELQEVTLPQVPGTCLVPDMAY